MVLAEELRQAILQAALQGKLTEQLDTDSSVEELMVNIQKEKDKLIADKVIKKEKQLPQIQDEDIPYDIPDNWRWVRLGDVVKTISAGGDKPKLFSKEKTKLFSIPVIANGETNEGILGYTDEAIIKEKSLTVSGRGTIGFSIVRTEPYVPIVRLLVITPLRQTNLYYIQCVLKSLVEIGIGTAVKQLTVPMIQPKVIPFPPIEEQQRIVDKINEIMPKIDEYEKIEKELEALKKEFPTDMKDALLQAAMQGKLTAQLESDSSVDELLAVTKLAKEEMIAQKKIKKENPLPDIEEEEIPFDIPENWRWVRMGNVIKLTSGQDLQPDKYSDKNIGIPYLTGASNFQDGNLVINRYTSSGTSMAYNGDLLLTCKGTIGEMAFLKIEKAHIARQIMSISAMNDINLKYIKICLDNFILKLKANARSIIPGIDRKVILNLPIPLPSIEEQQRIVERLDALLPLCEDLKE